MQVAIYTRVSTERQEREQTIESQLAVLRAWVEANGQTLDPEHVFLDEGSAAPVSTVQDSIACAMPFKMAMWVPLSCSARIAWRASTSIKYCSSRSSSAPGARSS